MQRKERLQGKIELVRERIEVIEKQMEGIDSTNVNEQQLQSIAILFKILISWVMGEINYVYDYDKVLDYVMHRDSSLNPLEISGLFMLGILLDIIDVWIKFVHMLFRFYPKHLHPEDEEKMNDRLNVVKHTVDIMQKIVLAAKAKSMMSEYPHTDVLVSRAYFDIKMIKQFELAEEYLRGFFQRKGFFRKKIQIYFSFAEIGKFLKTAFTDKVKNRVEKKRLDQENG